MATKITNEILLELGFEEHFSPIQNSFNLVIEGRRRQYKAVSLTICNDKGNGEYYLFVRQGETAIRHEDDVIVITNNMEFKEDLEQFLKIIRL